MEEHRLIINRQSEYNFLRLVYILYHRRSDIIWILKKDKWIIKSSGINFVKDISNFIWIYGSITQSLLVSDRLRIGDFVDKGIRYNFGDAWYIIISFVETIEDCKILALVCKSTNKYYNKFLYKKSQYKHNTIKIPARSHYYTDLTFERYPLYIGSMYDRVSRPYYLRERNMNINL